MRMIKVASLGALICAFTVVCGQVAISTDGQATDQDKELYDQIELFSDTLTIVQSEYVTEQKPKDLIYGALGGMLSTLDGYSQFMDPESFREMEIETKGEFGGLGIEIGIRDGVLTVIAPIDGTPAHRAGLKGGDKIVKIDGELTRDITLMEAVKKLRGKPKTKVDLMIMRTAEDTLLEFTIVRSIITLKSIKTATMLDGSIGYIKLVEFQKNSPRDLTEKLEALKREGMQALILDLRNNPGGLLDVAHQVSDTFLEKGTVVVSLQGRSEKQNKVYTAEGKRAFTDFPMVVMVNEGSASASEIVAGAVQDNKRGVILGTKTFGKGSVQTVVPLKDGSAVRITTAAYYTPDGRNINEKGIMPDVVVEYREVQNPAEEEKGEALFKKLEGEEEPEGDAPEPVVTYDNQLEAAVNILKGILLYTQGTN
jgi:carboxyl-terminal processing protease